MHWDENRHHHRPNHTLLKVTVAPTGAIAPLSELRDAVRAPADDEDDTHLASLLLGQTKRYQDFTGRTLLPTSFEAHFRRWSWHLDLPVWPIRQISGIAYTDSDGADQSLDASAWRVTEIFGASRIDWTDSGTLPDHADREDAIRVSFTAGCLKDGEADTGLGAEFEQDAFDKHTIFRMVDALYNGEGPIATASLRDFAGHRRLLR